MNNLDKFLSLSYGSRPKSSSLSAATNPNQLAIVRHNSNLQMPEKANEFLSESGGEPESSNFKSLSLSEIGSNPSQSEEAGISEYFPDTQAQLSNFAPGRLPTATLERGTTEEFKSNADNSVLCLDSNLSLLNLQQSVVVHKYYCPPLDKLLHRPRFLLINKLKQLEQRQAEHRHKKANSKLEVQHFDSDNGRALSPVSASQLTVAGAKSTELITHNASSASVDLGRSRRAECKPKLEFKPQAWGKCLAPAEVIHFINHELLNALSEVNYEFELLNKQDRHYIFLRFFDYLDDMIALISHLYAIYAYALQQLVHLIEPEEKQRVFLQHEYFSRNNEAFHKPHLRKELLGTSKKANTKPKLPDPDSVFDAIINDLNGEGLSEDTNHLITTWDEIASLMAEIRKEANQKCRLYIQYKKDKEAFAIFAQDLVCQIVEQELIESQTRGYRFQLTPTALPLTKEESGEPRYSDVSNSRVSISQWDSRRGVKVGSIESIVTKARLCEQNLGSDNELLPLPRLNVGLNNPSLNNNFLPNLKIELGQDYSNLL